MSDTRLPRHRRAQFETLEARHVMAAGVTAALHAGVLHVVGTEENDHLYFRQYGNRISIHGVEGSWSASKVKSVVVDVRGGNDFVSLTSTLNGGNKSLNESVTVVAGAGGEHVRLGDGHDLYFSGLGRQLQIAPGAPPRLDGANLNLSNSVSATLSSGVLTVTGTSADDRMFFRQSNGKISILNVSGAWSAAKVKSIVVNFQDGNDYVSLNSLANGGSQALSENITINSGGGDERVRLANAKDVYFSGPGHVLKVATDGTATLDGKVLSWDPPTPPPPPPEPVPPPPTGNWFDANIQDAALRGLGSSLYVDSVIDRTDILALLESAEDSGTVDTTELSDLQKIVGSSTLFGTFDYVWKLTSYIVSGNTANAKYQGQTLGNLAAGSSATHLESLVNKWFLGLDRPAASSYAYTPAAGTLFVNGAAYTDIDQGILANCAFMASLAETALRNPSKINSMFVVNGDGTYTVRFYRSGVAEYVTVDAYLPTSGGNFVYALGGKSAANTGNELWVALAEKAYAQVGELSGFGRQNTYASIQYLYAYTTLGHITGQSTVGITYTSGSTSLSTFATAYNAGKMICLITYASPPTSGIVANHAYAVVGYDATAQTVTLFNPWGSSYGLKTLSWSQVQTNFQYFDRTA